MPDIETGAPDWVFRFYDRKGEVSGPSGVLEHHQERAAAIERFGGKGTGRVLELGAGAGGSAVATAELGYEVVAVELSAVRADFARQLVEDRRDLSIEVLEADFMTVELPGRFDAVTCWNGFGVGSDADQRGLLRRVREWLAADGVAVLDVFSPLGWCRSAGESSTDDETGLRRAVDFDAVESRFVESWWFDGESGLPLAQSLRCYSLADFRLLLEGTGLRLVSAEVEGRPLEQVAHGVQGPLGDGWGYRVLLACD